jgi:hypothetical protein
MGTIYTCDRCSKQVREDQLFLVRILSKEGCNNIPSGILFGLAGEYCEECTKIIQKFLHTSVQTHDTPIGEKDC